MSLDFPSVGGSDSATALSMRQPRLVPLNSANSSVLDARAGSLPSRAQGSRVGLGDKRPALGSAPVHTLSQGQRKARRSSVLPPAHTHHLNVDDIRRKTVQLVHSRTVRAAKARNMALMSKKMSLSQYYGTSAHAVFLDSVGEGNIDRVIAFLEDDDFCRTLPKVVDHESRTALHLAALEGYQTTELPLVRVILEFAEKNGCLEELVTARDKYRNTALLLCCKFKSHNVDETVACLRHLLSKGARPWAYKHGTGMTPLHWLCHYGLCDGVESLLQYTARFDARHGTNHVWDMLAHKNRKGMRPIDIAGNNFKISVEYDKLSPFPEFRVERKFADIVKDLLLVVFRQDAEIPSENLASGRRRDFMLAAGGSDSNKRIDIDEMVRARERHRSKAQYVVHPQIKGDKDAAKASRCHFYKELLADCHFLQTAMYHASLVGDIISVRHCIRFRHVIQKQSGVCMPDPLHPIFVIKNSPTPLHAAAEMGHREVMQQYVELYEYLAVEHLRRAGDESQTPYLNFNVEDEAGFTPLHMAVLMANIPRLSNRIDVGASVTTVIYLMLHGANPFAMNKYAFTPARYASATVSSFMLTMVHGADEDSVRRALEMSEAEAVGLATQKANLHASRSARQRPNVLRHFSRRSTGKSEVAPATLLHHTSKLDLTNATVGRAKRNRLRSRQSSIAAARALRMRSDFGVDVDGSVDEEGEGEDDDPGTVQQEETKQSGAASSAHQIVPVRSGANSSQKRIVKSKTKKMILQPKTLPRVASRPVIQRLNSSAPEDMRGADLLKRRMQVIAETRAAAEMDETESVRQPREVKAIDIFEVLSKTRTRSRGKIDFVLVFQHKFKHLVDKVHDQLEATGLTIQQVQFPILAPKKYMILVSCMSNVIAKYAEDIGFEKKLVLTEDRLPFRVRAQSMFEPFRSRDRQEVIMRIMKKKIKLQSYLTITSSVQGTANCCRRGEKLMTGCFPMHNLQTCSELRQLMRDNVMGLLYPLNRFWEYTLESPKNEFYIVNLLAGYLGEKNALFFHFLSFYTVWLLWITVPGTIVFCFMSADFYDKYRESENLNNAVAYAISMNWGVVLLSFIICVWSAVFTRLYSRKEKEILCEWDMINFKERELERSEFIGDEMISLKTSKLERHYPSRRRRAKKWAFIPLVITSIISIWVCYWAIEIFKYTRSLAWGDETALYVKFAGGLINGAAIIIMNMAYCRIALLLTKWENHQWTSDFDRALILKTFLFQFFNQYLAVFVCIFWYQRIDDAAILVLALMVLTQVFNIVVDHAIPTCKMQSRHVALNNRIEERNSLKTAASKGEVSGLEKSINSQSYTDLTVMQNILVPRKSTKSSKVHTLRDAVRNGRLSLLPEDTVRQVLLNELCDPTDDMHRISQYMDIVLQFGFVVMFSACMPLAPLLAFANNMWEFRGEVTLATYVRRRTTAEGTGGIGIWVHLMDFLVVIGAFTTAGIVLSASEVFDVISVYFDALYPTELSNISFVWGNLPVVMEPNHTEYSLGLQAQAIQDAFVAEQFFDSAQSWLQESLDMLNIVASDLNISSRVLAFVPTAEDVESALGISDEGTAGDFPDEVSLQSIQIPDAVYDASTNEVWLEALDDVAHAINATLNAAVAPTTALEYYEWNRSTYEFVFVIILEHLYILIFVLVRSCVSDTPYWVRATRDKKAYKTNLYSKAALNLDNQRETSGSHYKPKPLPTNTIRLRKDLDDLVTRVAMHNHEKWCEEQISNGWTYGKETSRENKTHCAIAPFDRLSDDVRNVNKVVAEQSLKGIVACGFDIVKKNITSRDGIEQLHRCHNWKGTKLLPGETTFSPKPMEVDDVHLPSKYIGLVELLAEHAHESWAETKMHAGWSYGKTRNDAMKQHPMLVPYKYLLDSEKAWDRDRVLETIRIILALGFDILNYSEVRTFRKDEVHRRFWQPIAMQSNARRWRVLARSSAARNAENSELPQTQGHAGRNSEQVTPLAVVSPAASPSGEAKTTGARGESTETASSVLEDPLLGIKQLTLTRSTEQLIQSELDSVEKGSKVGENPADEKVVEEDESCTV